MLGWGFPLNHFLDWCVRNFGLDRTIECKDMVVHVSFLLAGWLICSYWNYVKSKHVIRDDKMKEYMRLIAIKNADKYKYYINPSTFVQWLATNWMLFKYITKIDRPRNQFRLWKPKERRWLMLLVLVIFIIIICFGMFLQFSIVSTTGTHWTWQYTTLTNR